MEEDVPEFTFENARYTKIEGSKVKTKITADKIEQYKSDGTSYAKNSRFSTYDSKGELETEGSCALLAADTKNETYTLFYDIHLELHSEDTEITAQALQYNGKTEQIVSSARDEVTIRRKETTFRGTGFSASGVSHTFAFESGVTGTIQTSEDTEQEEDSQTLTSSLEGEDDTQDGKSPANAVQEGSQ